MPIDQALAAPAIVLALAAPPGLALLRAARAPELGLGGAVALGLGATAAIAFTAGLLGLPLTAAAALLVGASALGVASGWASRLGRPLARPGPRDALVAGLGALAAIVAAWQGPWLSHTADTFYHLAAVRSVLLKDEAFATLPLYAGSGGWPDPTSSGTHTLLALAGRAVGADAVATWRAFHPVAAALSAAALARFAWLATGRVAAAPLALAAQLLVFGGLDLRMAGYPSHLGMALFWTTLWLALRADRVPAWAPALGLVGLAAIHVGLATAALAAVGGLTLARLVARRGDAAGRLLVAAAAGAVAVAARSGPLVLARPAADARVGAPAYASGAPPVGAPALAPLVDLLQGAASAPPPPAVVATALALGALALWRWRRSEACAPGLGALVGASLLPLAVALAWPAWLAGPPGYALARVAVVMAAAQPMVVAWAVLRLGGCLANRAGGAPRRALAGAALLVVGWSAAGGLAATAAVLGPSSGYYTIAAGHEADRTRLWADRIAALAALPRGTVVIAHPDTAYELAGLADVFVTATPKSHTPAALARSDGWLRRGDSQDLIAQLAEPARLASIAERLAEGYLLVDASSPFWPAWRDRPPALYRRVGGGVDWGLFRYDRAGLPGFLGPIALSEGAGVRWGVAPPEPLAGEVAFVRLDGGVPARLVLRTRVERREIASAAVEGGLAALRVPVDAPVGWYELAIGAKTPADAVVLGPVPIGHEYELESFPIPDLPTWESQPRGWALYEQAFYGRHGAARANGPAEAARAVPELAPGRYSVRARGWEYEYTVPNHIEVRFGGAAVLVGWPGGSGAPRVVSNEVVTAAPGRRLEVAVLRQEQPYVIVDWLRVYPGRLEG